MKDISITLKQDEVMAVLFALKDMKDRGYKNYKDLYEKIANQVNLSGNKLHQQEGELP